MKPLDVVFCVDLSNRIGLGHFVRCRSLAEEFRRRGWQVRFWMSRTEPASRRWAERQWPGIEWMDTAPVSRRRMSLTRRRLRQRSPDAVVADLSHLTMLGRPAFYAEYLQSIRREGVWLAMFDGLGGDCFSRNAAPACDALLVPYIGVDRRGLRAPRGGQTLVGPSYFVLKPDVRAQARRGPDRSRDGQAARGPARRIYVSMGGSDPLDHSLKVLRALDAVIRRERLPACRVDVGVGPAFAPKLVRALEREAAAGRCRLVHPGPAMIRCLSRADLFVTAGGLSKYEAAFLGVPTLILCQFPEHDAANRRFARSGAAVSLQAARQDAPTLERALARLVVDAPFRRALGQKGKKLIDGRGAERIADFMENQIRRKRGKKI